MTAAVLIWSSCGKQLDINENPNKATETNIIPELVLPQAIAKTDSVLVLYHNYGAFLVGYQLPGSGISGYGDTYTYNFTSGSNNALWNDVFSNLRNYQFVIRKSEADPAYVLYHAVARIFKAFNYQLLVDAYGDVPFTEGLQGAENLTPGYDDDAAVYQLLVSELDQAIGEIKANIENVEIKSLNASSDPLFAGNLTKWIQFANNIKLRLLVRARGSSIDSFVQTAFGTFSEEGFLLEDALINPGYNATAAQNPFWTSFHSALSGSISTAANYYIPSIYLFTYYDGRRLNDPKRGSLTFRLFPNTAVGQLGDETNNPNSDDYVWYIGTGTGSNASNALGILKGRSAGSPAFLAAETYFLLSEAALYGHPLAGDAKSNFDKGIAASFTYLEKDANNNLASGNTPDADAVQYQADNASSYLANYELASSDEQRLEAIITQKYIALNFIHGHEAWNEFRRTAYPKISNGATSATATFTSIQSNSTRADKLPVRNLYPQTEINLNPNVPKLTNAYSDPIFWDAN